MEPIIGPKNCPRPLIEDIPKIVPLFELSENESSKTVLNVMLISSPKVKTIILIIKNVNSLK